MQEVYRSLQSSNELYNDHHWDVVVQYVSIVSGVLSVVSLGGELFSPGLACYPPDNVSSAQAQYANNWCFSEHLSAVDWLPRALAIQGILLYVPSLVWNRAFTAELTHFFTDFFTNAKSIDLRRDLQADRFSRDAMHIVDSLRKKFENSRKMRNGYAVKLVFQLLVTIGGGLFFGLYFRGRKIVCKFSCDVETLTEPRLSFTVGCVYPRGSSLETLRRANFAVLVAGALGTLWGLLWMLKLLPRKNFSYRDVSPSLCAAIRNDMQLLLLLVCNSNSGLGHALIQILKELQNIDTQACYNLSVPTAEIFVKPAI